MPGRLRARFSRSDQLTERPDFALVGVLRVPEEQTSPGIAIARRIGYAFAALLFAVVIVYLDRDGYRDAQGNALSLLDCIYYATVSLSTTGYGDITPVHTRSAPDQRSRDHPAAGVLPDRAGRNDIVGPDREFTTSIQDPTMEAPRA